MNDITIFSGLTTRLLLQRRLAHLKSLIVNEDDKLLFDEATRCLIAGANRSAYITTWLCAAASIRSKLEIVGTRDSHIGEKLGEIEDAESKGKSIDKMLLDTAKDYGMISNDDFESLENVRRRRNIYAHPRRSAPVLDEVLGSLGTVVRSLLSKPPLLRYGYASDVIKAIFEERHFLDDLEDRVTDFGKGFRRRINPQIHSWAFRAIIERLDEIWDDGNLLTIRLRGQAFANGFLLVQSDGTSLENWKLVDIARKYPKAAPIVLSKPEFWTNIPLQAREIVIGYLAEALQQDVISITRSSGSFSGPLPTQAFEAIKLLHDAAVLSDREEERFLEALRSAPLNRLVQYGVPLKEWVDKVIESLVSYNWYVQSPAIDALVSAGPEQICELSVDIQEVLGRNVLQTADGGERAARRLLNDLESTPSVWPVKFLSGILYECFFHESEKYRFKNREMPRAIRIICRLPHNVSVHVFDELISSLSSSSPKGYVPSNHIQDAIELISNIEDDYEFQYEETINPNIIEKMKELLDILHNLYDNRIRATTTTGMASL